MYRHKMRKTRNVNTFAVREGPMREFEEFAFPLKLQISLSPEWRTVHNVTYLPLALIKRKKERKGIFELDFMDLMFMWPCIVTFMWPCIMINSYNNTN
jgi:hypothetical protein